MSLESYGIVTATVPNGGWRFPYPLVYSLHLKDPFIRAHTGKDLVKKVRLFRIEAGLVLGDVDFEVSEFIKRVSPDNDRYRGKRKFQPAPEGQKGFMPLIERIKEWLIVMGRKRGIRLILEPDANERANICEHCPQNVQWKTKCEPCNENIEYRGQNLRQCVKYKSDGILRACRLHNVLLPAAVFLDRDHLPPRKPEAPENCWMP